jgi:hypothetical protein
MAANTQAISKAAEVMQQHIKQCLAVQAHQAAGDGTAICVQGAAHGSQHTGKLRKRQPKLCSRRGYTVPVQAHQAAGDGTAVRL